MAQELGIQVAQVGAIGWSETTVPDTCAAEYAAEIALLGLAIRAYRRAEGGGMIGTGGQNDGEQDGQQDNEKEAKKRRNGVAAICGCDKPRRIRVAWSVWETGPIACGVCDHDFHDPDQTDEDQKDND